MWDPYRWMRDEERERTKIYACDVGCGASGSDERLDTRAAAHAEQTGVRICLFWRRSKSEPAQLVPISITKVECSRYRARICIDVTLFCFYFVCV
jgi:hypothetical protein